MSLDSGIRNVLSNMSIIQNDINELDAGVKTKQDALGALSAITVNEVKANTITLAGTKIITRLAAKQDLIKDDNLLISYTTGLQAALNDLSDNDVSLQSNIDKKQDKITNNNYLEISDVSGLSQALENATVNLESTAKLASVNTFTANQVIDADLKANNVVVAITTPTLDTQLTSKLYVDTEINKKQDTITTSTDLETNSITTNNLNVNGGVCIDNKTYFDTIVIRRPTGITGYIGGANSFLVNLRELQCWVNGINILFNNGLTSYFAEWTDKDTDIGFIFQEGVDRSAPAMYNNVFEAVGPTSPETSDANTVLIIKNIPYTNISTIQSLVLYNRDDATGGKRAIGLAVELYNSINDPDLTELLATTNVITTNDARYRFDFPSLSTYTGSFATANSTTNIVSDSVAFTEEANVFSFPAEITGDVVANGVNINTTLADILSRLELLENS